MSNDAQQLTILDYHNIAQYIQYEFFVCQETNGQQFVAICDLAKLADLPQHMLTLQVKLLSKEEFYKILEQNFSTINTIRAKYWLDFISPKYTAKNTNFVQRIVGFNIIFFVILTQCTILFHLINNISYFIQNILKAVLFTTQIIANTKKHNEVGKVYTKTNLSNQIPKNNEQCNDDLPIYSVLIPLYQETEKLESIIKAVSSLNYPKNKLDVKIILESDDLPLINFLAQHHLPSYIHVIIVPFSFPRTKPKALNYAMNYARGKYITVYDAEDQPEPDQLLKVVHVFRQLSDEYACIQAKLCMYNTEQNILTRLFAIEYSIWFEHLLPGLNILKHPIPLGGTSNHFKADILRSVGCWDAYNVTEDAELGIRLYLHGYKSYILDSYTFEEASLS